MGMLQCAKSHPESWNEKTDYCTGQVLWAITREPGDIG